MQDLIVQNLLLNALERIQHLTYSTFGQYSTTKEISRLLYKVNEIAQNAITERNKIVLGK